MYRLKHAENAHLNIFVTFDGIKISLILKFSNVFVTIVSKLEFGGISILVRFMQPLNAHDEMILIFDGNFFDISKRK